METIDYAKKMRKVTSRRKLTMENGFFVPGPNEKNMILEAKKKRSLVS